MTQTKVEDYSVFELLLSPTIALTYFKQECYPTSCFRVFTCYQGKKPAKLLPGLQCTISTSTNRTNRRMRLSIGKRRLKTTQKLFKK